MGLLDGKVVLVTGGTSGIGRASAVLFAQEGAKVALTGRRAAQGKAVVAEIEAAGGDALYIEADLTDIGGIAAIVDKTVERYGRLDGAFNNAGATVIAPLDTIDEAQWDMVIDTNMKAQFFCLKAQIAQMKKQGHGGSIVFTGSVLASITLPGTHIYSASKAGVDALARAAAVELGPVGIRVNSINPSITRSEMTQDYISKNPDGSESHPFAIGVPLGRIAEAEEMAQVALFLLSDRSSYVSGQALIVDGGQSSSLPQGS